VKNAANIRGRPSTVPNCGRLSIRRERRARISARGGDPIDAEGRGEQVRAFGEIPRGTCKSALSFFPFLLFEIAARAWLTMLKRVQES
jgi:hypothetical protein